MRLWLTIALSLAATPARAMSVDCRVDVSVDTRISALEIDQQVGSERLDCLRDPASQELQLHVVRIVKTAARAHAQSRATARGSASARYWDSCHCSGCSGHCSTSGSGSDSCSDDDSGSASSEQQRQTTFSVARAGAKSLAAMGYVVSGGPGACELKDAGGDSVDLLRSIALVTWAYGGELLERGGADLAALNRAPQAVKVESLSVPRPERVTTMPFDGIRSKP